MFQLGFFLSTSICMGLVWSCFLFLALGRIALRRWSRRLYVYFSFVSFTQKGRRFMLFNRQLRQVNPATTFSRNQCRNPQRINS
ncbi:uncharacterized protein B0J16DRAFT_9936 [Fusarium flagelliforme]|uniref:uncharacterized protein n=1 Tax=Fusarium flagelliforme TaxID=2675880 RepID=UPI001E8E16C0|nr:uncharacterized protein B0J16DRAFT_9936 [Fusarium flagelliforme]KAH7196968.1 hypothetical protein B0J16DRAFT_9936 [Fusarium flagelliforme]